MKSTIESLKLIDRERIEVIAEELANYGLGIFEPHAHNRNGDIVPLPDGVTSYESDLKVSFVRQENVPGDSVAVGWRWQNGELTVCANCCKFGPSKSASQE
jgi:hypothetical protein